MPYKCCVPGCRAGYTSVKVKEKVGMYQFPKELQLKEKWISAIPRKNWTVSPFLRVCARHFSTDDFVMESRDQRTRRLKRRDSTKLKVPRLKKGAIPHVFPQLPKYLSKPSTSPRSFAATSSARLDRENRAIEKLNSSFLEEEIVENLTSLKEKLEVEVIPSGYTTVHSDNCLQFHYISEPEIEGTLISSRLLASVLVYDNLELDAFVKSSRVPSSMYEHLLSLKCIKTTSDLTNILAFC